MTVAELKSRLSLDAVSLPEPDCEVTGGYVGDLLSWVMGRASAGDAWITIMSNMNVAAVASLADVSCVIFSEGVMPDENVAETAAQRGINMLCTRLTSYETAVRLSELLK